MPYIKQEARKELETFGPKDAGELNYAITRLLTSYWTASVLAHGGRYQDINDIIGALEGAKAEFQRRVVAPYEDKKIEENGDVY